MSFVAELVKGKTFEQVKEFAKDNFLNIEEDGNLYSLSFTEHSDTSKKFIREANGVIFEKETNKLVHYCFEKTYEGVCDNHSFSGHILLDSDTFNCDDIEKLDYTVEHYTEGSLIKVYWYNGKWNVGSSRKINAAYSFWGTDISLKECFYEAMRVEEINLEDLPKDYCYSFILQHPKIKICMDTTQVFCMMINKVNLDSFKQTRTTENFVIEKKISELASEANRIDKNYIVFLEDGTRIKIINEHYKNTQKLLGNHPSIKWAYLESLKDNTDHLLRINFKSSVEIFDYIDDRINETVTMIHSDYMDRYVKKLNREVYHKHEKSLGQLHGIHRKTKERITPQTVHDLMMNLKTKSLYWLLNL